MPNPSFACDNCSATIRYAPEQAGRKAKCPRCKQPLVIPRGDVVAEEPAPVKKEPAKQALTNLCAGCGARIRANVTRCKACRAEAKRLLDERMGNETRLEDAYAKQAQFLASMPRGGPFPHGIHLAATICTGGLWLPFYVRNYMVWKSRG